MKKVTLLAVSFLLIITFAYSAEVSFIIPQKDKVYSDLSYLSEAGYIKTAGPSYFNENAITRHEAASYIAEAADVLAGTQDAKADELIKKYEKLYSSEITALKDSRNTAVSGDVTPVKTDSEGLLDGINMLEKDFALARFTDSSPFKITGIIGGKYQNLAMFGLTKFHRSSFAGTHIEMNIESALTDKVKLNSELTLEIPQFDPAFGTSLKSLDGILRPIWVNIYTLTFDIYGFRAITGLFWEDITSLVASQSISERLGIFDRDKYAGEENTKTHFETVFRNFSQNRDQRWSKHQFHGAELYKDGLFGKDVFKVMGGRAMDTIWKNFTNEYAARYTHFRNFPGIRKAEWSVNWFNSSNDIAELSTLDYANPEFYKKNISIIGADMKATILGAFNLKAEFERSWYTGSMESTVLSVTPHFYQDGNAVYASLSPVFLPKNVDLVLRYTMIDPGYTAPASAVSDTNHRAVSTTNPANVVITPLTYAGDPTSLRNNMHKIEAHAYVNVPFGIMMINYGVSAQIQKTGNMMYSSHWLLESEYWNALYSNWGYPGAGEQAFMDYNQNRYGSNYTAASMIASGTGGLSTELFEDNKEYMALSGIVGKTQKYYSNLMILLRYEVNRLVRLQSPLLLELYAEINTLTDGADFIATYDPSKLFAQFNSSACLVYNIMPKMNLIGFAAMERWGANRVISKPIDYLDTVYGFGIDYDLAGRAFLYLRLKNLYHTDYEVHANDFRGFRVWAELKSFF